jgi:hypothetical protein
VSPADEYLPASQVTQPLFVVFVPAWHSIHSVLPAFALPLEHVSHVLSEVAPTEDDALPDPH